MVLCAMSMFMIERRFGTGQRMDLSNYSRGWRDRGRRSVTTKSEDGELTLGGTWMAGEE
jgi:hypothetical protein